jgi:hypothetical protein
MSLEPKDIGPILIVVVVAVIIIVKQLLSHQRQMTALLHRVNRDNNSTNDTQQLQSDMQDLKQLVHRQTLTLDELSSKLASTTSADAVQERLVEKR